jgi:N-acetyl-anhydromuramyl-L-alanine amidase AmpD
MKITNDHLIDSAAKKLIPGGAVMAIRRFLVIHFTAGATGQSSIDYWKKLNNGVCAHIVIERDGSITQCRPFNRTAGHAGSSKWTDPKTGLTYFGLNACSIGIELANAGDDSGALSWARRLPGFSSIKARHKNGGPVSEWEDYPDAQLASCEAVSKLLVARYNLDDLVGHDDIAPSRKTDPGPALDLQKLRDACGFSSPVGKL